MKNKFYTSILWIGLAIASTTPYAKPNHFKHTSASTKNTKVTIRHVIDRNKPSTNKHFPNISSSHKKTKFRSIFRIRRLDRRSPVGPTNRVLLTQENQQEHFLEPAENNGRTHSLIPAQTNNDLIGSPTHYSNGIPHHITSVHGTINSSLSAAGQKAGLSNELIFQLTNIFAWDIDFANNLHQGDQFTVVFEETGLGDNSIIAAEFVNQGRILTAIRYKNGEGQINYYSPEGKPMRKAFLSTPVDFVRISSGFDTHRKHPILNRIRAHKGIDYAARTGTPVKSAGDGEVIFRGRKGGYGQVMIVRHGDHYETLYAHLADFKEGINPGDPVKQGEVIGYVGQTGLATGPHLHYEFRVDGVHSNPEALNFAQSSPLHDEVLADFKAQTSPLLAQLNQTKAKSLFAKNQYGYN